MLLALAGGGVPKAAPPELAAVLGDRRFLLPRVGGIAWMQQSPDEKLLAVPFEEDLVLFEVATGKYLRSLKGLGGRVVFVTLSRDSHLLAATTWIAGENGAVRVWELRTNKESFTVPVPGRKISGAIAFSGDGKRLVEEGAERLQVCDAHTGKPVQTVPIGPGGCGALCFSPNGRQLAAALWQAKTVKVFGWAGGRLVDAHTLKGHSAFVGAVVYSPDGKLLASGASNECKLWDTANLRGIRTVQTAANELVFTPDSQTLYAASCVGKESPFHTVTGWDVSTLKELPPLIGERFF
jgi:WD40 repeat protein